MNYEDLEIWSQRAAEALQDFCNEAQEAIGIPEGECQLMDIRNLLAEHARIVSGLPNWQIHLSAGNTKSNINFGD
jgi:hypothetical protein